MRHPGEERRTRKFAPKHDKNYSLPDYAKSVQKGNPELHRNGKYL